MIIIKKLVRYSSESNLFPIKILIIFKSKHRNNDFSEASITAIEK